MCSQSPRLLPRLYLSERSESPRERGFHDRRTVLSPASCKARKKPLRSLKHSSSSIGVIIGAIGITSGPLSTQDGGTSDRSLKAATNPSRLPRRLRLIKRYTSSPACFPYKYLLKHLVQGLRPCARATLAVMCRIVSRLIMKGHAAR